MLLCPTEYEEDLEGVSKRRQFIHCQWAPPGAGAAHGEGEPGVVGTVGALCSLCLRCRRASGWRTEVVCVAVEP